VLGAALPVIVALVYFRAHGVLELALRTTFQVPSQVAKAPETRDPASRMFLQQAIKNMFPVVGPLAAIGLLTSRRQGRLTLAVSLTACAAIAFGLALPQLFTAYRLIMLAAPVGLLAVGGLESVLGWLQAWARSGNTSPEGRQPVRRGGILVVRSLATLAVVALTVPLLSRPIDLVRHARDTPWSLDQRGRIGRGPDAEQITQAAAAVSDRVRPGEQIYVMGDPGVMSLLHANQGAEVAGWSMQLMPADVWAELTREIERSRPALIFVDDRGWVRARAGSGRQLFAFINQQYRQIAVTSSGTWYQTDHPGAPLPEPGGNHLFAQT
jgi:hypothetical protein